MVGEITDISKDRNISGLLGTTDCTLKNGDVNNDMRLLIDVSLYKNYEKRQLRDQKQ